MDLLGTEMRAFWCRLKNIPIGCCVWQNGSVCGGGCWLGAGTALRVPFCLLLAGWPSGGKFDRRRKWHMLLANFINEGCDLFDSEKGGLAKSVFSPAVPIPRRRFPSGIIRFCCWMETLLAADGGTSFGMLAGERHKINLPD